MADPLHTSNSLIRLRVATEPDTSLILVFIQALADYEQLSHEVVADAALVRRHLFSDRPAAEVIIAEYDGEPAGFALFFQNFSTFLGRPGIYLEDLYVHSEYRSRGIGKQLLRCLASLAVERGCGRLEWAVLDWNESAIQFYRNLGAQPLDEWTTFRIAGEALNKLAANK